MNSRAATPLTLLSLALTLAACGGGNTTPPGTPVTSLTDSGAGSLREAISAAAAGDTLRLTQTGTLTLNTSLVIDKNVTIVASNVTIDAPGKGRAVEIAPGASVTIKGGTLKGGTGAVLPARLNAASVGELFGPAALKKPPHSLRDAQITAQAATPTVGGVLLNRGTLTLDGVTITGGKANVGGGIYNAAGAALTLQGTTSITGNTADLIDQNDDTIDQGMGGGIFNKGTLTVLGGSVSTNTAYYSGGGIRGGVGSSTTISGGKVDGNTTTYPVTVEGTVTNGAAGGGIFTSGDLTVTGGSVSGNSTSYFGGGITVQSTCADAQCTTINRPVFNLSGGTIENNSQTDTTGVGGGGGLWSDGVTTITGGTVRGNAADGGAGFVAWYNADITGGVFEGNRARGGAGGIFFLNSGRTYHIGGTTRISGNTAGTSGGGINIARAAQVTMDGGTISGNTVTGSTDGGGGVRVGGTSSFTLAGGEIKDNTAFKCGGGIVNGGIITMTGGSITGNRGTGTGQGEGGAGGINLYAGSKMTASGGTISNNEGRWAGGVQVSPAYNGTPPAEFTLAGATVSGNRATAYTGGGFNNDGKLTITSGSVTGNTAAQQGGGVFNTNTAVYAQPGGSVTSNTPDNVFNAP